MRGSKQVNIEGPTLSPNQKDILEKIGKFNNAELQTYQSEIQKSLRQLVKEEVHSIGAILRESYTVLTVIVKALSNINAQQGPKEYGGSSAGKMRSIGANLASSDVALQRMQASQQELSTELLAQATGGLLIGAFCLFKLGVDHHKDMLNHEKLMKHMEATLETNLKIIESQRDIAYGSTQRIIQALEDCATKQIELIKSTILAMGESILVAETGAFKSKLSLFSTVSEHTFKKLADDNQTTRYLADVKLREHELNVVTQSNNMKMILLTIIALCVLMMVFRLFNNPAALNHQVENFFPDHDDQGHFRDNKPRF